MNILHKKKKNDTILLYYHEISYQDTKIQRHQESTGQWPVTLSWCLGALVAKIFIGQQPMNERSVMEINRLKEEIYRQKEAISDIKELVKTDIDRDFPIDPWELSDRELDNEMGNRLSFLNTDIDPRPDPNSLTSHRKMIGKPIVRLKRWWMRLNAFYTEKLLEKQWPFNDQLVFFNLASFIRFRHNEQRIKSIEDRLNTLEENQELLLDQLRKMTDGREK